MLRSLLFILVGLFLCVSCIFPSKTLAQQIGEISKGTCTQSDAGSESSELKIRGVGTVESVQEFVCKWSISRRHVDDYAYPGFLNTLSSVDLRTGTAYLLKMTPPQTHTTTLENDYYVTVKKNQKIYYNKIPLTHSPGYNEVRLRAFRSVNVPEAKREYLWTEFYRKLPKEGRDTTHANWFGYVHTFHSQDQPAFRPINNYVSINSPCLREENGDPSIPVRDMKIVDGEMVETSQVTVRLPRPGIAVVTPQSGSLTKGQKSWLGTYALHSSFASDPMATVKGILTDTSGCETTSEEEKR